MTLTVHSCGLLSRVGNTGIPGVWLFHTGNRYSFDNVVPASVGGLLATPPPDGHGFSLVYFIHLINIHMHLFLFMKKISSFLSYPQMPLGHHHPWVRWVWRVPRQHIWAWYPGGRTRLPSHRWRPWISSCTLSQWPVGGPSTIKPCSPHPFRGLWPSGSAQEWRCTFDPWTQSQFWASSKELLSPQWSRKSPTGRGSGTAATGRV